MTISSIYSDQPGSVGAPDEACLSVTRNELTARQDADGALQEVTDQARLSSLAPRIQAMFSETAGAGDSVLDTLSANVAKLQDGFVDTLYAALSEENIDLSQKITLRLDGDSALTVAGDHPEKNKVNAALADQPALSKAFSEIASQSEVLRDITNINKVMSRYTGMEAYAASGAGKSAYPVYQMSLKGEMSHFYFSRG